MSVGGIFNYINHWYGVRRLHEAMSAGIIRKAGEARAVTPKPSLSSSGPLIAQSLTYEHPFLGLNLDMLI